MAGYSSKCSVCTHKHADTINDMLRRRALGEEGITFEVIAAKMEALGFPVTICALSRHNSNHFDVAQEGRRRAMEQYDEASEQVAKKVVSDLAVLDKIRDVGMQMIEDGELVPDIKDVVNAINTKHKTVMKEENPLAALLDLVAEAARKD